MPFLDNNKTVKMSKTQQIHTGCSLVAKIATGLKGHISNVVKPALLEHLYYFSMIDHCRLVLDMELFYVWKLVLVLNMKMKNAYRHGACCCSHPENV